MIASGEGTLWAALLGYKDEVPAIPVVKMIADKLRSFFPTFLGQIGVELVMPPAFDAEGNWPCLEN